jgi:DNA-binding transcriptional ArsR family regulator
VGGETGFVDREEELRRAEGVLSEACQGRAGLALILGEPGVGKSRFLREVEKGAAGRGMACALARAAEFDAHSPYRCALSLIRTLGRRDPEDIKPILQQLSDEVYSTVVQNIPEFVQTCGRQDTAAKVTEVEMRCHLFSALGRLFWQLSQDKPLFLQIENAACVDPGTVEVIKWVLKARRARVAVAATQGAGRAGWTGAMEELVRIPLGPLPPEAARQLARSAGGEPDDEFLKTTRGNPLYILSAVRYGAAPVPATLDALMKKLLERLDPDAAEFLSNAAVAGEAAPVETLRRTTGLSDEQVRQVIGKLKEAALVDVEEGSELRFASRAVRDSQYESISEPRRQEIHRHVAEAFGGEAAPEVLAHHYQRAGDSTAAARYRNLAEERSAQIFKSDELSSYRNFKPAQGQVRIPECTTPLSPEGLKCCSEMSRNLISALKLQRAYEPNAPALRLAREILTKNVLATMMPVSTLTLGQTEESLTVNGQPFADDSFDGFAGQIYALLRERYIKALTLAEGVTPDEVGWIVQILAPRIPSQEILADELYWAKKLTEGKVEHAEIVPLVFVPELGSAQETRTVEGRTLEGVRQTIKSFKATIDSLRYYPPGNSIVLENLSNLEQGLNQVFESWRELTFTVVEDRLIVNGLPADEDRFGPLVNDISAALSSRKVPSVTFFPGVSKADLDPLVRGFAAGGGAKTEGELIEMLKQADARNLAVGDRVYTSKTFGSVTFQGADLLSPVEQAERWLKLEDDVLLGDAIFQHLVKLMDVLEAGHHTALCEAFIDRYRKILSESKAPRACAALIDLIRQGSPQTSARAIERIEPDVLALAEPESSAEVRKLLIPETHQWLRRAIGAKQWEKVNRLLASMTAQPEPELADSVSRQLDKLHEEGRIQPLMEAFFAAPQDDTLFGCVQALGKRIVPSIAALIPRTTDALMVDGFMKLITSIDPEGWKFLPSQITDKTGEVQVFNILTAMERAAKGTPEFGALLLSLAPRPEVLPTSELLRFAESADAENGRRILIHVLQTGTDRQKQLALNQAVDMKLGGLGEAVLPLLVPKTEQDLLLAACRYLKVCPHAGALEALVKIYEEKPGFFKVRKGLPIEVRSSAVFAIGAIKSPEAQRMIRELSNSKEVEIRAAAKAAQRE